MSTFAVQSLLPFFTLSVSRRAVPKPLTCIRVFLPCWQGLSCFNVRIGESCNSYSYSSYRNSCRRTWSLKKQPLTAHNLNTLFSFHHPFTMLIHKMLSIKNCLIWIWEAKARAAIRTRSPAIAIRVGEPGARRVHVKSWLILIIII